MSDQDTIRRADAIDRITKLSCDDDAHWGSIVDALRAIPAVQVGVKPLIWVEETDGSGWYAVSMGYQFTIRETARGFRYWCFDASHATFYPTIEAAKAAAQADYEARILSALTVQLGKEVMPDDQGDTHSRLDTSPGVTAGAQALVDADDIPELPEAYRPRNIAKALTAYRAALARLKGVA